MQIRVSAELGEMISRFLSLGQSSNSTWDFTGLDDQNGIGIIIVSPLSVHTLDVPVYIMMYYIEKQSDSV